MDGRVVALVCAVRAEERMLRRLAGPGVRVIVSGMGSGPAEQAARDAIAAGATAAISVGFCGALDPALQRGDLVVPARVRDAATGDDFACDPALAAGAGAAHGVLVTSPAVAGTPADRRRLPGTAVDMESAGTARACARAGIPFAAIRAVTDRAEDRLPDITGVVDSHGAVHPWRALRRLVAHPSEVGGWVSLALGARAARRSLVPAVAAALGASA
jgi:uridine phosphorylase